MKKESVFKTAVCLWVCILYAACAPVPTRVVSAPSPEATVTPRPAATVTVTPAPTQIPYHEPTLIPILDPAKIPALLKSAFSLQSLNALDGHRLLRITGWSNGFNGGDWSGYRGYIWMTNSHILLFPATGEFQLPNWTTIDARPVVMDLDTGKTWLPPADLPLDENRSLRIALPRWSSRLNLLVTAETVAGQAGVSTFSADGKRLAHYQGRLVDVSPSAERIFFAGDTWLDLGTGRKVDFGWGPGSADDDNRWLPIWSRDENQIYFCCYFYGNAKTGKGYAITNERTIFDGGPFINNMHSLRHAYGVWLNDHVVMAQYDAWWYEGPGFTTIFDVTERTYHNFGVVAGLPDRFNDGASTLKIISPDGDYMYISPGAQPLNDPQVYLVDLRALKSQPYPAAELDWSPNGKYAIADEQVLTLSDKSLRPLPAKPDSDELFYWIMDSWHPSAGARLSIYADKQKHQFLYLLDVETLTYRRLALPSNFDESYGDSTTIAWNPQGDRFVLAAGDGSLWQLDYPKLENLQQLTAPMPGVKDLSWSADGTALAFAGGMDIYVLETGNNP